jgi:hypothetical protein
MPTDGMSVNEPVLVTIFLQPSVPFLNPWSHILKDFPSFIVRLIVQICIVFHTVFSTELLTIRSQWWPVCTDGATHGGGNRVPNG